MTGTESAQETPKSGRTTEKGKGRIFKRADGKYLIYLPKDVCEDSMFPFKLTEDNPSIKLDLKFTKNSIIAEA